MDDNNLTQPEVDQARHASRLVGGAAELYRCTPDELVRHVEVTLRRIEELETKLKELEMNPPAIQRKVQKVNETWVIMQRLDPVSANVFPRLAEHYLSHPESRVVGLAGQDDEGKVTLLVAASKDVVALGFSASAAVKAMAAEVGGKGGGKACMARGGGANPSKILQAFEALLEIVRGVRGLTREEAEAYV